MDAQRIRTVIRNRLLAQVLMAGVAIITANQANAQAFTTLHNFTATAGLSASTNADGSNPDGSLIVTSNTLYGTAYHGGTAGNGAIFSIHTDGTVFTNLHNFTAINPTTHTNSDGINPEASLLLSSNILYGTASGGGSNGSGTVFSIKTDGTLFKVLHSFTSTGTTNTNGDGTVPLGALIVSSNLLYGTASSGGLFGSGTVFRMKTDGTGFTNLHYFTRTSSNPPYTNSDGAQPVAGLVLSTNLLYGTTYQGGKSGNGAIFKMDTNGGGFSNVYNLTATSGEGATNGDGAKLNGGVVFSSNYLYGLAYTGGAFGFGTVFKVKTDGTGITTLHNFDYTDGEYPNGSLALSGNTLIGAAAEGGSLGSGTVFAINTDGTGFTNLHDFSATILSGLYLSNLDGANIGTGVVFTNGTVYGTAFAGGGGGNGTVFGVTLTPQLNIDTSGAKVILSWPTTASGFALQATTNLASSVWTNVQPPPVSINGVNTVTNSTTGTRMFYRLMQ
jgi:uncharacterized repeat protein (TIGR03803 family)